MAQCLNSVDSTSNPDEDPSLEWFRLPEFRRYWQHYDQCMSWMQGLRGGDRPHAASDYLQWGLRGGDRPHAASDYLQWCQFMASYHSKCAEWMYWCSMYWMQVAHKCFIEPGSGAPVHGGSLRRHRTTGAQGSQPDILDTGTPATKSPVKKSRKSRKRKRQHKKRKEKQKLAIAKKKAKKECLLFSDLEDIPSDLEFVLDFSGELENGCIGNGVEYHMEITEDMLEFFAQSAKHKQEREAQRKAEGDTNDDAKTKDDFTDLASVSAHRPMAASTEAPREQPGVRRAGEMSRIYGAGSAMIHAMETAMQLTYHRNCDRKQPKLWPNLPLNIIFD